MAMARAENSTTRFSSRVADYVASRPKYHEEIVPLLVEHFGLQNGAVVADIGSGTAILSAQILDALKDQNVKVIGVEPNKEMREAGDAILLQQANSGRFCSRDGTAEATGLEDASVDLIVAGQAFHWFDIPRTREEFKRVLKPGSGGVALLWNERIGVDSQNAQHAIQDNSFPELDKPVKSAYDLLLLKRDEDHEQASPRKTVDEQSLKAFFGPDGFLYQSYPNPCQFNWEQLKRRLLSSSHTPQQGDDGHKVMIKELRELFDKHQKNGKIDFLYKTIVLYSILS